MRKSLFIIPLALTMCQCMAAEPSVSPILQQAYDRLLSVNALAFGDVRRYWDVVCTTSVGEESLRTLTESTNGLPLLRAAVTNGTTAAKLYALCGIRRLAPEQFDSLAATLAHTNSLVGLQVGSIGMVVQTSTIVAQIKKGAYEDFLPFAKSQP